MNLKLITQLSIFGLIMAFGTISLIPQNVEPAFWLFIFIFCAIVIARVCPGKYFLHGFLLSLLNSVWITTIHMWFYPSYAAHHPDVAAMSNNMGAYLSTHPRVAMLVMAPVFGVVFGLLQGTFAFIASKIITKKAV
ncbi:hypothetical protein FFF34_015065 [Inquilinus sp. KBS0705]|nr:hypothetical protein FFF34_015065 [Inquilinus sp. KBS0705]